MEGLEHELQDLPLRRLQWYPRGVRGRACLGVLRTPGFNFCDTPCKDLITNQFKGNIMLRKQNGCLGLTHGTGESPGGGREGGQGSVCISDTAVMRHRKLHDLGAMVRKGMKGRKEERKEIQGKQSPKQTSRMQLWVVVVV